MATGCRRSGWASEQGLPGLAQERSNQLMTSSRGAKEAGASSTATTTTIYTTTTKLDPWDYEVDAMETASQGFLPSQSRMEETLREPRSTATEVTSPSLVRSTSNLHTYQNFQLLTKKQNRRWGKSEQMVRKSYQDWGKVAQNRHFAPLMVESPIARQAARA